MSFVKRKQVNDITELILVKHFKRASNALHYSPMRHEDLVCQGWYGSKEGAPTSTSLNTKLDLTNTLLTERENTGKTLPLWDRGGKEVGIQKVLVNIGELQTISPSRFIRQVAHLLFLMGEERWLLFWHVLDWSLIAAHSDVKLWCSDTKHIKFTKSLSNIAYDQYSFSTTRWHT